MKTTQNLEMKIPEGADPIDIADITGNFEKLDTEIAKKANASGGDISAMAVKTLDTIAAEFPVPSAGESSKTFLGKVRKFVQDFNNFKTGILTLGRLVNNGQTTEPGFALDARYGRTLYELYAQLNADIGNNVLKKNTFLASEGDGCGFMFSETGNDTGMGSDGDGNLYFMTNGVKNHLGNIALTYFYESTRTVDLDNVRQTGFHRFQGSVPVFNGPSGMSYLKDCTMLVSGAAFSFQIIFAFENIYYRHLAWNGVPSVWWRIPITSS